MKKYTITVNGTAYEVLVEEGAVGSAAPNPVATPVSTPAPTPAPAAAPAASAGAQGSIQVKAPMPGTILKMNVKVGDKVEPNGLVCILEAMKM